LENEGQSWARLAATFGFSDHAHLSREFRALTGTSPSGILERVSEIRHVNVRP
jgi:AraC-like DNA-binding protein